MVVQIQKRRDTAANWTANNPTLAAGEAGYETDTGKMKIGDGATAWVSLAYFGSTWDKHNILAAGTQTANTTGTVVFSNSNGVTFGMSNNSVITASVAAGGGGAPNVSAGTTSNNLSAMVFSNSNGVSFGLSGSTITGSHNGITSQSNQALSGANGSFTFQTATFADSNGVSFSTGTQGLYATVATNYAASNHSHGNPTLALTNISGTTASNSAGLTLSLSAAAAGGAGDGVNILAAGTQTAATTGTVLFNNSNGITFGMSNSSVITASHNGLTTQTIQTQNMVSVLGSTGNISFANSNGITIGANASTITLSHNGITSQTNQTLGLYAVSNTTGQSSSTTIDARTLSFHGAGIASVGYSGGSVVISVPAGGGGGDGYNIVQIGTTGTTGTSWSSATATVQINGSNGITVSQNNSNQIVISGNGATLSNWMPPAHNLSQAIQQQNSSVSIVPFRVENHVTCSDVMFLCSRAAGSAANTSSAFLDLTISAVLYSLNGSTLSSLNSGNTNYTTTWSSNGTGSVASVGWAAMVVPLASATLLTPGNYWLACHVSTANTATGGTNTTALGNTISMCLNFSHASDRVGIYNFTSSGGTSLGVYTGMGIISTGATRDTIAISAISQSGSRGLNANLQFQLRNTQVYGW